ncbi:hypothetical protein PsYK624_055170 [Phanerochaete sordida]|uniref:Heterokaryon incompatibility domain-containing protein n=1 Tax=Phanerochaete sordida TaxID=48140 RepID=A0A9P3G721_9APHY|nr:hypothetical protein PsYK624_055170 [Phanerochaete sordida]
MSCSAFSLQDTAIGRLITRRLRGRRDQYSGSKASTADSTAQAADTPRAAQSPQSRKRWFVLEGTSIRILGSDVPWSGSRIKLRSVFCTDDVNEVQVSASRFKRRSPSSRLYEETEQFLEEKRRTAWGMAQIAQSGEATEEALFSSSGYGRCFTLRPPRPSDIPLQWTHIGCGAITNDLADVLCEAMTVKNLLDHFNDILGADVSLDIPGLSDFLDEIRHTSHDFGVAYGKVRVWWARPWHQDPLKALSDARRYQREVECLEREVDKRRRECADAFSIGGSDIPPRRVWDLYSNRVLPYGIIIAPYRIAGKQLRYSDFPDTFWTVSHGWVAAKARESVWTPINENQWPVPIPRATTLEHVRIELLNIGAEYVWIDVLCLRQEGRDEDEVVRIEEWKVDVPTIGYVYRGHPQDRPCATYFNGLGLPLDMAPDALESETHWLNRVWTLQETLPSNIPCGLTGLLPPVDTGITALFSQHAALLRQIPERRHVRGDSGGMLVQELQRRSCSNELDRITGLAYIIGCETLPVYRADADVEGAWQQLLKHAPGWWRLGVLCVYAADAPFTLFPSWAAYAAANAALNPPECRWPDQGLMLVDEEQRRLDKPGQYCHQKNVFGPCRLVGRAAAGDSVRVLPRLEISQESGQRANVRVFTALRAHGVLLEGIDYQLVIIGNVDNAPSWETHKLCVVVEVVAEGETSERRSRKVEAIRWAVVEVDWEEVTGSKSLSSLGVKNIVTQVTYLPQKEALQRTAFKERYLEAFRVMTERKDTLIVSK